MFVSVTVSGKFARRRVAHLGETRFAERLFNGAGRSVED
jgi:hypothetical protein